MPFRAESSPDLLRDEWLRLHALGRRARDVATELGVAEAELVASAATDVAPGYEVTPLTTENAVELFTSLESLGVVKTQTRTASVVLEVIGHYPAMRMEPDLERWCSCFAVREGTRHVQRTSLQVFDPWGVAVQKIFLLRESDVMAFETIVRARRMPMEWPVVADNGSRPKPSVRFTNATTPLPWLLRRLAGELAQVSITVENLGVRHSQGLTVRRTTAKNDWLGVVDREAKVLVHRATPAHLHSRPESPTLDLYVGTARDAIVRGIPMTAAYGRDA
jgi:hypothetical protein